MHFTLKRKRQGADQAIAEQTIQLHWALHSSMNVLTPQRSEKTDGQLRVNPVCAPNAHGVVLVVVGTLRHVDVTLALTTTTTTATVPCYLSFCILTFHTYCRYLPLG